MYGFELFIVVGFFKLYAKGQGSFKFYVYERFLREKSFFFYVDFIPSFLLKDIGKFAA